MAGRTPETVRRYDLCGVQSWRSRTRTRYGHPPGGTFPAGGAVSHSTLKNVSCLLVPPLSAATLYNTNGRHNNKHNRDANGHQAHGGGHLRGTPGFLGAL